MKNKYFDLGFQLFILGGTILVAVIAWPAAALWQRLLLCVVCSLAVGCVWNEIELLTGPINFREYKKLLTGKVKSFQPSSDKDGESDEL
ncbi:hypothetical protein E2P64_07695 [Candidatus Bathyarchaeota archaeon]|nr:hypothetical protein E2P64_07695 [Candidatus Bathyarchaeota archaeon]